MTHLNTPSDAHAPDIQPRLAEGMTQRQSSDRQMIQALIKHLETPSDTPATLVAITPHCSLDCWLRLYRQALARPLLVAWARQRSIRLAAMTLRNGSLYAQGATTPTVTLNDDSDWRRLAPPILHITHVIDPDAAGLPCLALEDPAPPLQLSAGQVLRFYGYPPPHNRLEQKVVLEEMRRLYSFCHSDGMPTLATAYAQASQDLRALAEPLLAQITAADLDEAAFNPLRLYPARVWLTSQSFCARTLKTAASLLKAITTHPQFVALAQTRELDPGTYEFDPLTQAIRGASATGTRVDILPGQLAQLSLDDRYESLKEIAQQLNLTLHIDGQISQAHLLTLHGLALPATRDAAWDLIDQLRDSQAEPIPPSCDLANSDIALMQHRQQLAIAHDRDTLAMALDAMVTDTTPVSLRGSHLVMLTDAPLPHPALAPLTPHKQVALNQGLQRYNLTMPLNQDATQRALHTLQTTLPVAPRLGNYWAALGMPEPGTLTLSAEQRDKILRVTSEFLPRPNQGLLSLLAADLLADHTLPAQADELLLKALACPAAQRLTDQLIAAVQWHGHAADEATSRHSRDALLLAAVILNLDPHAGERRATVAGLDLNHSDYRGRRYPQLRTVIELHLIGCGVATAASTSLAAHILLAGVAPEFLVQAIPNSLYFMSSHAWMIFKQGVMLAEALACGSARHLTFSDIMTLALQAPGTDEQQRWRAHYADSSLIDWAEAVGLLQPASAEQTYDVDAINAVKSTLATRIEALRNASNLFASPLVTRQALAHKDLEKVFPGNPWLATKCLRWGAGPIKLPSNLSVPNVNLQSLVDLHMSGHLQPFAQQWNSAHTGIDLARMKPRFARLTDVNTLFRHVSETRVQHLKDAYTCVIQYLLSQLPLAVRTRLQESDVHLLVIRQPARKALHVETLGERIARTGRFGFILSYELSGKVHYFEMFPLQNLADENHDFPAGLILGGESLTVPTGNTRSTLPSTRLYLGSHLPIDEQAYLTGRPPRAGVHSTVIVEQLWRFEAAAATDAPMTFDSPRCQSLARTIVEQHFFLDIDALLAQARGTTVLEERQKNTEALYQALLGFIPFWSCSNDLVSGQARRQLDGVWGCFFDAIGLFAPTQGLLIGGVRRLRTAAPAYAKLLQLTKLSAHYLNETLNPFEALPSLLRLSRYGLIRLNQSGQQLLNGALRSARQRITPGTRIDYTRLVDRADAALATVTHVDGVSDLLVIKRPNAWYAFDPCSGRPYGPELDTLRLVDAIEATPMSLADGYKALVTQVLFDTPPLLIQRANATDLLDRGRVWRLRHSEPSHLDELTSPAYFYLSDQFEWLCPRGRQKRSPIPLICLTKKVHPYLRSMPKRRVQALEHVRLIPAPLKLLGKRQLVFNRSVCDVTPDVTDFKLTPLHANRPLQYKAQTTGQLIDEPEFGLPAAQVDGELNSHSVVVELEGIVTGIDDSRTLRALSVTLHPPCVAVGKHLVVEADVGVFYKTTFAQPDSTALRFNLLDYGLGGDHSALINAYGDLKNQYMLAAGVVADQPLVALPTLEALYGQLTRKGWPEEKIALIRVKASSLPTLKQRELLLNTTHEGRGLSINVVAEPVKLDTWPPAPTASQRNRYLAEQANISTQARVEKTGIGSANLKGFTRSEAIRQRVAAPVVMWEYSKTGHPNYTEVILKTGAGNCDQLAHVARELIRANGGTTQLWGTIPPAHAFVLVGTPPAGAQFTADFSEPQWASLWVCDPWTSIVCPANVYMRELAVKMQSWHAQRLSVLFNDGVETRWGPANDPAWLNLLKNSVKYAQV